MRPCTLTVLASCVLMALNASARAEEKAEIGYIASFNKPAESFILRRDGVDHPLSLLTPVRSGDVIEVRDPAARITLRLVGRDNPVIVTQANDGQPLEGKAAERGLSDGLLGWAAETVAIFDRDERERVVANIRGGNGQTLTSPVMGVPQRLTAGRQVLAFGWTSPRVVNVEVFDATGRNVISGKGVGPLWLSPPVELEPGRYRVKLTAGSQAMQQELIAVAQSGSLALPAETEDASVPDELSSVAKAAYLAATGPEHAMDALATVGPIARSSAAARLVALAIINGQHFPDLP